MISLLRLRPYTGELLAPSPNHGPRKAQVIQGIVLHATADQGDENGSLTWMLSPKSRVSCHLLVGRAGDVTRLVGDQQRAWHAGAAWWHGTNDVNSITLGIEIANRNDGESFTELQYRRVADIVAHYCKQGLSLYDVVSHAQIAPGRRSDPLGWDWSRFRTMVRDQLTPDDMDDFDRRWMEYDELMQTRRPSRPRPRFTPATKSKSVLSNRTVWVNGITAFVAGSVLASQTLDLAYTVGLTLPDQSAMWVLVGIGMLNILFHIQVTFPTSRTPSSSAVRSKSVARSTQ